ncbi:putative transmembrane protein [Sesbania bispinosa]|nr:putative transmembrane protein [Sesbania bispinosa]
MDTRLNSVVTFLTLILLASLFASLVPVSEARPLLSSKDGGDQVNGVFRTLKGSGPSPGIGHRLKKLQNVGGMKESGPSPGIGHKLQELQNSEGNRIKTVQVLGVITHSGPSPGVGHKYITNNHS